MPLDKDMHVRIGFDDDVAEWYAIVRFYGVRQRVGEHPFVVWCGENGIALDYDPYGEPDCGMRATLTEDQAFAMRMAWDCPVYIPNWTAMAL